MFRNQYDGDVTTWSPEGRLFQLEYAVEAVKQGSAAIGLKSKNYAVLVALKRAQNDLTDHQQKVHKISKHCGIAMSGLTSDGRSLTNFMRQECMNEEFTYDRDLQLARMMALVGDRMQRPTQIAGRRPYGCGLLVAGYDESGPHIYETCPSSNYYDCIANAIGQRTQSAKTYITKNLDKFGMESELTPDDLVKCGLEALRETLPSEQELSEKTITIAIVGKGLPFDMYDNGEVKRWLDMLDSLKKKPRKGNDGASGSTDTTEEEREEGRKIRERLEKFRETRTD